MKKTYKTLIYIEEDRNLGVDDFIVYEDDIILKGKEHELYTNLIYYLNECINLDIHYSEFALKTNLNYMRSYERIFIGLYKVLNYLDTFKFTNKLATERIINKFYQYYKSIITEDAYNNVKSKYTNSRLVTQSEEIQILLQLLVKFMKKYVYGNNQDLTFHQLNASLKVDSGNEFIYMTFSLGICVASTFFFIFTYYLIKGLGYTIKSDSHNLMSHLTIMISFVVYLFYQRYIIEDMDKHEIDWRRVLEANVISQSRLYLITSYGTAFVYMFIISTFIYLLYNLDYMPLQWVMSYYVIMTVLPLLIILMPFKAFNYTMRYYVIKKIMSLFLSPFVEVRFVDNLLADGLTSLTKFIQSALKMYLVLWNLLMYDNISDNVDKNNANYSYMSFTILIPFWIRLMQCLNKFYNTGELKHALNFLKYLSALAFILCQIIDNTPLWLKFVLGAIATIYAYVWDVFVDWGALYFDKSYVLNVSKGKYSKSEYIISCVLDLVLRSVWIYTLVIETPDIMILGILDMQSVIHIASLNLEIYRRLMWAKYRIENETRNLTINEQEKMSVMMLY